MAFICSSLLGRMLCHLSVSEAAPFLITERLFPSWRNCRKIMTRQKWEIKLQAVLLLDLIMWIGQFRSRSQLFVSLKPPLKGGLCSSAEAISRARWFRHSSTLTLKSIVIVYLVHNLIHLPMNPYFRKIFFFQNLGWGESEVEGNTFCVEKIRPAPALPCPVAALQASERWVHQLPVLGREGIPGQGEEQWWDWQQASANPDLRVQPRGPTQKH